MKWQNFNLVMFQDRKSNSDCDPVVESNTLGLDALASAPPIAPVPVLFPTLTWLQHLPRLLEKKPSTGELFPELDGLRGLAVLMVLASHTNLFHLRGTGAVGVWLFFVLSSFLLARIIRCRLPGSLSGRELCMYLVRRIARIIPTYYVVLAVVALVDDKPLEWLIRHCIFLQADGHFWTIPQEEVFYVLLPFFAALVYLLERFLGVPAALTAGFLLWLGIEKMFPSFSLPGNGIYIRFYVSVFLTGFFVAHLWEVGWFRRAVGSNRFRPVANIFSVVALGTFVLSSQEILTAIKQATDWSFEPAYWGWTYSQRFAAASAILLIATLVPNSWTHRLFSSAPFRLCGVLSFGIYLVHYRIIAAFRSAGISEGSGLFLATLTCSFLAALLLERTVEGPGMRIGKALNQKIALPKP